MAAASFVTRGKDGRPASAWRYASGFTLLEILVVIVIIGIIVTVSTLSINVLGRDSQVEDEARRLFTVLQQAKEEAEIQGLDLGVRMSQTSYEFIRYSTRDEAWMSMSDDRLYGLRKLPDGLRLQLQLDSREIVLKPELEAEDEAKAEDKDEVDADSDPKRRKPKNPFDQGKNGPQIVVLASGEILPFALQLERAETDVRWQILGKADSSLSIDELDERS